MGLATEDKIYSLAADLTPEQRLRLVERIVRGVAAEIGSSTPRTDWVSVRGIAPALLGGEDAQEWVSRSRRAADDDRELRGVVK